jgi:hypothetical protein
MAILISAVDGAKKERVDYHMSPSHGNPAQGFGEGATGRGDLKVEI